MASNWETAGKIASGAKSVFETAVPFLQDVNKQRVDRNEAQRVADDIKSRGLFPKASKEEEFAQTADIANRYAPEGPQYRTQNVKQDLMTPWQQTASNLSLLGSAPGQLQKAVPGLLPAIKKYGGRGGAFINELFGPQTGHYDEYARQQMDDFERKIVPQITAKYGLGEEVARDREIAAARSSIDRDIVGMKAKAHEQGLERNAKGSQELYEAGLKPQFKWGKEDVEVPRAAKGESPSELAIAESVKVKNPLTQESESPEAFIDKLFEPTKNLGKGKLGASLKKNIEAKREKFKNLYKNSSVAQQQAISKVLSDLKTVGGTIQEPTILKDLKTGEDFEKYYRATNYGDPEVAELAKTISNKKDLDTLYSALEGATPKDKKIVEKLAVKYGLAKEKEKSHFGKNIAVGMLSAVPLAAALGVGVGSIPAVKTAAEGVYGWLTKDEEKKG